MMGAFGSDVSWTRGLAEWNAIIVREAVLDVGVSRFGHVEGGLQQWLGRWEEDEEKVCSGGKKEEVEEEDCDNDDHNGEVRLAVVEGSR